MSERMRRVVASPKTENISAKALVVMAKTATPWSVKSTVSIMSSNAFFERRPGILGAPLQ
jgi:hypothetical protein